VKRLLLAIIRAYQYLLSPWVGNQCRFYPTCSHYAAEAIQLHGAAKGSWLAIRRISKCHPWHPGGFDAVPGSNNPCPEHDHHDYKKEQQS
jgi:hypothetical protein